MKSLGDTAPVVSGTAIRAGAAGGGAKPWEQPARETAGAANQDASADDFDDDF